MNKDNQKGVSIVVAILSMVLLGLAVLSLVSITVVENKISLGQLFPRESFYGAEAFLERGIGALIDDATAAYQTNISYAGYSATAHFDAYGSYLTLGAANNTLGACFYTSGNPDSNNYAQIAPGGMVLYYPYYQSTNVLNSRIKKVEVAYRVCVSSTHPSSPSADVTIHYNSMKPGALNILVVNNQQFVDINWPAIISYVDITTLQNAPATWCWADIANGVLFIKNEAGPSTLYVDYLGFRVTYGLDLLTEPWATGDFVNYPLNLGRVESVDKIRISDEQAKVHLNYAPLHLLRYLMVVCGVPESTPQKAQDIINSRTYSTIEEVVGKATLAVSDFQLIKDYITVYSWISRDALLPTGNRPPLNVNTADYKVLRALYMPPELNLPDASLLATDITYQRSVHPFTSMFSSNTYGASGDQYCFATFVDGLPSGSFNANQKTKIKSLADASNVNMSLGTDWDSQENTYGTEFCYSSGVYSIQARAKKIGFGSSHVRLKEAVNFPYSYVVSGQNTAYLNSYISLKIPIHYTTADYQNTKKMVYWRQIF